MKVSTFDSKALWPSLLLLKDVCLKLRMLSSIVLIILLQTGTATFHALCPNCNGLHYILKDLSLCPFFILSTEQNSTRNIESEPCSKVLVGQQSLISP